MLTRDTFSMKTSYGERQVEFWQCKRTVETDPQQLPTLARASDRLGTANSRLSFAKCPNMLYMSHKADVQKVLAFE